MKNVVEIDTTRGVASPLYSYIRRHTSELVKISGTVQRNYNMGNIAAKLYHYFLIRA
jgi:hypothetical protein